MRNNVTKTRNSSCLYQNPKRKALKYLQHNRYNGEKLSVPSELLAIVYLFPPSQPIVDALIIGKWGSFFPMKEVVSNLKERNKTIEKEINHNTYQQVSIN